MIDTLVENGRKRKANILHKNKKTVICNSFKQVKDCFRTY